MDWNSLCQPSLAKNSEMLLFGLRFKFWWSAGLVNGLKPHSLPLSSKKSEMIIFVLHSTSDDWPNWSMDLNLIHQPSPANKYEMLIFGLHSTSDD